VDRNLNVFPENSSCESSSNKRGIAFQMVKFSQRKITADQFSSLKNGTVSRVAYQR